MTSKQFNYLKSCINNKGQLVDKKLKAPLNFQYHYSSFILSSIIQKDYEELEKVLDYYFSIPTNTMKPSNDFNVVLLLFAILNDEDSILGKIKTKILNSISHNTDEELFKLNNNFRALRLLGMILESTIKNIKFNEKIEAEINWILDLQFDDGIFPDSNRKYKIEKNKGVPHLTYHTKIMMCVGFAYFYTRDERLKLSFFKAMTVLLNISIKNYYFFYGRSTNALFGYGSLYISFILAYKFSGDKVFLDKTNEIKIFLEKYQHSDGHISINLNQDDSKRLGFDGYMYDIVYNAYSNTLFLLADKLHDENTSINNESVKLSDKTIQVYKNSGFVVYQDTNVKYCFNYKGHQDSLKHRFDSRVSPFALLYYQNNNTNLLPAVGYRPQSILRLVETKFPLRILYGRLYKYLYFDWLPIFSGNSFFYIKNGIKFYPFKCIKMIKLKDKLILKFEAKSRAIFFDKNKTDYFVMSIDLKGSISYKIFFYAQVEKLYYSYRELKNKLNFSYEFSKKYKKLKTISVETSNKKADLHRVEFSSLKKIEIKVNTINEKQ